MSNKKTIEAYNKIAQDFQSRNSVSIYDEEYSIFKSYINKGKILEIGCGIGRDAINLIKCGFEYLGLDASLGMLNIAKEQVPDGKFIIGDFYKLDFKNNSFDGFWAAASFLHVPKKDIDIVLSEAKRVIKIGGIGFISLKKKTNKEEGIIKENKMGGIERYFAFYDENEFSNILSRNKFEVLKITTKQENDENKTIWLCYFVRKIQ